MLTVHDSKQKVVTLQIKELFFLAGILGSDRLLGVEDPFRGYMAEEIAMEWERVKTSLLDKGYLIQDQDTNELIMTPTVFQSSYSRLVGQSMLASLYCLWQVA